MHCCERRGEFHVSKGDKMDGTVVVFGLQQVSVSSCTCQHGTQCAVARPIERSKGPVQGSSPGVH